jgi:hypothetical protein
LGDHSDMGGNPRIRRLALIPFEGPNDELRRYRLARMDEIALATPPDRSPVDARQAPPDANGKAPTPPAAPAPPA